MIIDLHGHCTPTAYVNALLRRTDYPRAVADGDGYRVEAGERQVYRAGPLHWDLGLRLPALREAGVTVQALSLSCPYGFELLAGGEAAAVAAAVNEAIVSGAKAHGGQFLPLAVAPIDDSSEALAVLQRALAAGCRGMILSASVVARLAGDEVLVPYLEEVAAASGYVLLHPGARVHADGLPAFAYAMNTAGFQNELTVALFRLVFGGLLDRVPALPVVAVNLGGAAPLLAERMRSMWESRGDAGPPPDEAFRRVWYDFSSFREHSLEAAVAVLGADRIVLGTDYPIQGLARPLQTLATARLDDAAREAVRSGNALSFLADGGDGAANERK